jgi:hypothetical protein
MITENAYFRAEKRGFIGGNPYEDWLEAERDIDAHYPMDFFNVFSIPKPSEVVEHLRMALGTLRFEAVDTGEVVEFHRRNIEAITAANQHLIGSASSLVEHQIGIFHRTMDCVGTSLKELAEAPSLKESAERRIELVQEAVRMALEHMRDLAVDIKTANLEAVRRISKRVADSRKEIKAVALNLQSR